MSPMSRVSAMNEQAAGFLENAFTEILTNYAFLFGARIEPADIVTDEEEFIHAWIDILANSKSHLDVVVPVSLGCVIAANVLGVEEDDPLAGGRAEDCLKEMVNVLCGHLRTLLTQTSRSFEAAIPQARKIPRDEWETVRDSKCSLIFLVEDRPLILMLSMEGSEL